MTVLIFILKKLKAKQYIVISLDRKTPQRHLNVHLSYPRSHWG